MSDICFSMFIVRYFLFNVLYICFYWVQFVFAYSLLWFELFQSPGYIFHYWLFVIPCMTLQHCIFVFCFTFSCCWWHWLVKAMIVWVFFSFFSFCYVIKELRFQYFLKKYCINSTRIIIAGCRIWFEVPQGNLKVINWANL